MTYNRGLGGNLVHGLDLSGKVPGRLRQWGRAVDGRWVGRVDFTISDHHGATVARMERVVVPAEALSELEMDERRQREPYIGERWTSTCVLGGTSIVTCWFVGADPQRELHGRFGDDTGGRWRHRTGIIALLAIRQQRRYPAIDHQ